jgi:hypothetical protein
LSERRLPAGIMFAALQMYGNDDGANLYATQMHSDSGYLVTNGSVNSQRSAPLHPPQQPKPAFPRERRTTAGAAGSVSIHSAFFFEERRERTV